MPWTVLLLLLGPLLITLTAGCGRFPATPKPTTLATPSSTLPSFTHKKECTDDEYKKAACLNKGKCVVLEIGGVRTVSCECPKPYIPPRCQEIDSSIFLNDYQRPSRIASAGIAASVVAVVLFVVVLVCIFIWRRRYLANKKKEKEKEEERKRIVENGTAEASGPKEDNDIMKMEETKPLESVNNKKYNVYRNSVDLKEHFPLHRNSSGQLKSASLPREEKSYSDRPISSNHNFMNKLPSYSDIKFIDEEGDKLLDTSSSVMS